MAEVDSPNPGIIAFVRQYVALVAQQHFFNTLVDEDKMFFFFFW
jgi:hypothetical protein